MGNGEVSVVSLEAIQAKLRAFRSANEPVPTFSSIGEMVEDISFLVDRIHSLEKEVEMWKCRAEINGRHAFGLKDKLDKALAGIVDEI